MATDAIFRIASMSKAVTTVAVMMLYEEGKFMLHDPIDQYIPAFKNSVVALPAPKDAAPGVKFVTEKAKRPIQIRDLLTHTAGLTYGTGPAARPPKGGKPPRRGSSAERSRPAPSHNKKSPRPRSFPLAGCPRAHRVRGKRVRIAGFQRTLVQKAGRC